MFKWFIRSKYSIGDKVVTDNGFIGIIEAKRKDYVGYQTYERQVLVYCADYYNSEYGKHRWISEKYIAFKLSKAQIALFTNIYNKNRIALSSIEKLEDEVKLLKLKEDPNANNDNR